jgi:hypothetical protein
MSRPRSGRASTPAARAGGRPGVFVQAPKSDVYVALLGVAVGAMVVANILLLIMWLKYRG